MRRVVGVLVARPLGSQGEEAGGPTHHRRRRCRENETKPVPWGPSAVRTANCRWMAWRAEPLESTRQVCRRPRLFSLSEVNVVRAQENKLGM